ncbi:MAG: redoxin domain-containing protein [Firmicutes bacterium]|nr:redoxin domain-containing protein [Bacillota bacterium]
MAKVQVGDKFPNLAIDTLYKGEGMMQDLFTAPKTILWCLRYIGCTVCRYDIHLAAKQYNDFIEKGAKIVFMLQSEKSVLQEELKDIQLPFDIICDPSMKLYEELEIKPAESMQALAGGKMAALMAKGAAAKLAGFSHGKYEGNEQQLPAMFIVDQEGTVLESIYAENIMGLPTIKELLKMI